MLRFIDEVDKVRNACSAHLSALTVLHRTPPDLYPLGALGTCANFAIITLELATHYLAEWTSEKELARVRSHPQDIRDLIEDVTLWRGANTLRNKLIHNNAIGDSDKTWAYPFGTIVMERDREIQGTIQGFPQLTLWAVNQWARWCDRYHTKAATAAP